VLETPEEVREGAAAALRRFRYAKGRAGTTTLARTVRLDVRKDLDLLVTDAAHDQDEMARRMQLEQQFLSRDIVEEELPLVSGTPGIEVIVPFRKDSFELEGVAPALLAALASELGKPENRKIRVAIHGHTDRTTGTHRWNMTLSGLRALRAARGLIETHGLAPDRFDVIGHGPNAPLDKDETVPGAQERNRRVQFQLIP
jgi:outer membrane protein OmpA-like peptidoglycan-associated protein